MERPGSGMGSGALWRRRGLVLAAAILLLPCAPGFAQKAEILVSAASSLTDALSALAPSAEKAIDAGISLNFGASGTLRKQIEEGAPVDVFFSAASEDMDKLEKQGLIDAQTRVSLLTNRLVLIGAAELKPASSVEELRALLGQTRLLAVGNPEAVPAGRYAMQALASLGLDGIVKGKLALGGNVREVLQYVQNGSAPLGIVFSTDALTVAADASVRTLYDFAPELVKPPVLYPLAVVRATKNASKAALLIQFLRGAEAHAAFKKAGFAFP
jgi:molybdate transport system substrate-binding protein